MNPVDELRRPDAVGPEAGERFVTTEPTRRAVRVHRLIALAAAAAVVASGTWVVVTDPGRLDPRGGQSMAIESQQESGGAAIASSVPAEPESPLAADSSTTAPAPVAVAVDRSRFVDLPTTRVLDTHQPEGRSPVDPGGSATAPLDGIVPDDAETLVLSVNVAAATGPGPILVDAGGRSVTAIDVAGAGQTTTNLVLVPHVAGRPVQVVTVGGGHLVVDVVGAFTTASSATTGETAAGRFVPVATQRLARLVTEVDGREAVVSPLANPALPASGVASVLVRITADVGTDGGLVRLGGGPDDLPNTMMWAASSGDDRTRQGVAIVDLGELDELAFRYDGGSVLDLDVLGYFTDESAQPTTTGLFEPRPLTEPISVEVSPGTATVVDVAEALGVAPELVGAVPVSVVATVAGADVGGGVGGRVYVTGPGQQRPGSATVELGPVPRFGFTATEVGPDGTIVVSADTAASVTLTLSGYFLR